MYSLAVVMVVFGLERNDRKTIRCCWSASAWVSSPGCVCEKRLFQTRKCWSWWHRPGPLWSAWGGNLSEREQLRRRVFTWHLVRCSYNDSQNISKVTTCKQSTKAVLCHDPSHHAEGGAGDLTRHWEDKDTLNMYNVQSYSVMIPNLVCRTYTTHHFHMCLFELILNHFTSQSFLFPLK